MHVFGNVRMQRKRLAVHMVNIPRKLAKSCPPKKVPAVEISSLYCRAREPRLGDLVRADCCAHGPGHPHSAAVGDQSSTYDPRGGVSVCMYGQTHEGHISPASTPN